MYLRSLELQGFKSFPDKISLEFGKGITAVVGPNGSGKSNIGDAVRWVLGEQSSKTLRGAKMEDVIFAGTQLRKPMGFASVTLNIVNDKGLLNTSEKEVSVTRKLYRSGESEYIINGEQVRLKDVSELFMDTGLGRDGYSIIGQGKVAEIVSSRSSERRSIFEEAAGISKARYHKEDAENKLKKAEENIDRLNDSVSLYEEQLGPLKIQAEKAEKYIKYAEEKKSLEITSWMGTVEVLKTRIREIEDKLLINSAEFRNSENDINTLEEKQQLLSEEISLANIEVDSLQAELIENERSNSEDISGIAVLENNIKHAQEKTEELEKAIEAARTSSEENRRLVTEKLKEADDISAQLRQLENDVKAAEDELIHTRTSSDVFDRKRSEHEQKLNALYIRRTEINTTVIAARNSLDEAQSQAVSAKQRLDEIAQGKDGLAKEKAETEDGLRVVSEKAEEQNNRILGMKRIYEGKRQKQSELSAQLSALSADIGGLRSKERILTDLENSMDGYANAVKQILRSSKNGRISGIVGTVSQIVDVPPEYSTAIETALGGSVQNIVTEDEESAKKGIRLLKEMGAGRATFLPLTSVHGNRLSERGLDMCAGFVALACDLVGYDKRYEGVVTSILGRVAVAEDIDQAGAIAKRFGYKFRIVTLDGQVVNAGGSYTGGSVNRSSGILTRKNEIESVAAEIRSRTAEEQEIKERFGRLKAECDKAAIDLEALEADLRRMGEDRIRYESELKRIAQLEEQNENAQRLADDTASRLEKKREDTERIITENEKKLADTEAKIAAEQAESGADGAEYERLRQQRDELSERISGLSIKRTSLEKDREAALAFVEDIKEQGRKTGDISAGHTVEIARQKELIEGYKKEIEERRVSLSDSGKRSEEITQRINAKKHENLERERRDGELRRELKKANDDKAALSAERIRLEERRDASFSERDKILSDMAEQYELYPSEAEALVIKDIDKKELDTRLTTVRNRIRALGSINLEAIDDYKTVSEKYEVLSKQLADVNASKRELLRLIDEYTAIMKERFTKNFGEINTLFKKIFTELFGGGRAELVLTDPDDVLESGIEINVAPPGKVIGNLSLLSGGEQAFVAIAIYFAILRVRPAPFCILDEIEAALDDVNVSRYAQYLHNYTDTTQFITITHRRGTMEEADVFYGVTMQEKGISKLLRMEQLPPSDE
ncbi:MAG: chromosome segregation protein SMC [Oscillospiraceae bacterium]|nr:chromosome segregation protein SMC [Oscillospiraceae bacterium]